jgi:hypothetical protein
MEIMGTGEKVETATAFRVANVVCYSLSISFNIILGVGITGLPMIIFSCSQGPMLELDPSRAR